MRGTDDVFGSGCLKYRGYDGALGKPVSVIICAFVF